MNNSKDGLLKTCYSCVQTRDREREREKERERGEERERDREKVEERPLLYVFRMPCSVFAHALVCNGVCLCVCVCGRIAIPQW